jgi:hypothetical protein
MKTGMLLAVVVVVVALVLLGGEKKAPAARRPDPYGLPPPAPTYGYAPPGSQANSVSGIINNLISTGGALYGEYLRGEPEDTWDASYADSLPV